MSKKWSSPYSSTLASRFRTKKSLSYQNLPYTMLKTRFYFLYASTSLDTKTLTIASNRNFESCLSICCLAPQHIFRFFHLCRGFSPLSLATLLIVKSSSSTLYRAIEIKKKRVCEWLLFAGNHDPSSLAPGGSVVPLVCGFRR